MGVINWYILSFNKFLKEKRPIQNLRLLLYDLN